MRSPRSLILLLGAVAAIAAAVLTGGASASSGVVVVKDSSISPTTTTIGGASVLPSTKTVEHWHGTALNPAGNAALTDAAFVAPRFGVVQSRRHADPEGE